MTDEENPYLKNENYYEGYAKKADELKYDPEHVDIEALIYRVYASEDGKKLIEYYKDKFIFPGFVNPAHPNARDAGLWYEGFKEAYRCIINSIKAHEQRVDAENHK